MICPHCKKEIEIEDRGKKQKIGMIKKSTQGKHMSRSPFGYRLTKKGDLIPSENYKEIEEIFEEFLEENARLQHIAEKHKLSINGLKKILRNFAYLGKVKFDGQIHEGKHKPIVSSILFNKVQEKLDKKSKI